MTFNTFITGLWMLTAVVGMIVQHTTDEDVMAQVYCCMILAQQSISMGRMEKWEKSQEGE